MVQIRQEDSSAGLVSDRVSHSLLSVKDNTWENTAFSAATPQKAYLTGGASISIFNGYAPGIAFRRNQDDGAWFSLWKPIKWVNGKIGVRFAIGVAQNPSPGTIVTLSIDIYGIRVNETPTTADTLWAYDDDVPIGDMVANDIMISEMDVSDGYVTDDHQLLTAFVQRNARGGTNDNWSNDFYLFGVGFEYFARNKQ